MTYSIDEAIGDIEDRKATLKLIAKKYPKATMQDLPNGDRVWCDDDAKPTEVHAVASKLGDVFICAYEPFGNYGRVYGGIRSRYVMATEVLKVPLVRNAIIKAFRGE